MFNDIALSTLEMSEGVAHASSCHTPDVCTGQAVNIFMDDAGYAEDSIRDVEDAVGNMEIGGIDPVDDARVDDGVKGLDIHDAGDTGKHRPCMHSPFTSTDCPSFHFIAVLIHHQAHAQVRLLTHCTTS